jgi:lipid-A-disaccharide synthase
MRIFFSVGEPSGDLHAANLIAELRKRTTIDPFGLGGPKMNAAGCNLLRDMSDLALMGLFPVLAKLPEFLRLKKQVAQTLDNDRPDAVILIDYPGFNWHVARLAKERGIPVFYYGLPQLWAWATWRVKKVQRYVDHALCKLPFEEPWLRAQGVSATYVGHPYFDELRQQRLDEKFVRQMQSPKSTGSGVDCAAVMPFGERLPQSTPDPFTPRSPINVAPTLQQMQSSNSRLVTILPGSRNQEVKYNLPDLLSAAAKIKRQCPDVRFAIASYNDRQADAARKMVASVSLPAEIHVSRTPELIAAADCCLACSGSVSLELLYHAKPAVVTYRVGWLTYQVVRHLMNARYITLVNLLASNQPLGRTTATAHSNQPTDTALFPEFPTWRDCSNQIAAHAINWLTNEPTRQQVIQRLHTLRNHLATGGASARAADYIVTALHACQTRHNAQAA